MIQDSDFYLTLASYASGNLFLYISRSSFRVALSRQIHLKDEEDWEVGLQDIYLKSDMTVWEETPECFYIYQKAQDYFELRLPASWYVILPKTLACAVEYLSHQYNIPQLYQIQSLVKEIDHQSIFLRKTTTTLVRKKSWCGDCSRETLFEPSRCIPIISSRK